MDYAAIAKEVRRDVLSLVHKGQTSHIASNFSAVDLAVVLYENLQPGDRVCWSKGWAAALHYVLEIRRGNLDRDEVFNTFPNAPYLGLLEPSVPTVEGSGGAMGHLLPVAVGMALGKKRAGEDGTVYCIMSDGEMQEGTTWEAAALAAHNKLDNLVTLIDANRWCAMGETKDVVDYEPLHEKWKAFNWAAFREDGHYHDMILDKLKWAKGEWSNGFNKAGVPRVLIYDTVKGKGVSFMTDHLLYHYKNIDKQEYEKALKELS